MIRVNLLPIKQARRRSAGRAQLVVFTLLILAELATFGVLHMTTSDKLSVASNELAKEQQAVNSAKDEVKDAKTLEQEAERLAQQLKVLDELEQNRTGPVRVLDELQAILSTPRNEEDRFAQLQRNWNVEWDPRRLWLEKVSEKEGTFDMEGVAGNADDVAEFLQRLTTAKHFTDIQLDIVEAMGTKARSGETKMVKFKIYGKISYAGGPVEATAENKKKKKGS